MISVLDCLLVAVDKIVTGVEHLVVPVGCCTIYVMSFQSIFVRNKLLQSVGAHVLQCQEVIYRTKHDN